MRSPDEKRKRTRTILTAIILATIPCYLIGIAILRITDNEPTPVPTVITTEPAPATLVQSTPTITETQQPTSTLLPVIIATETWTPTMTFTLFVPPTRTPTMTETPEPYPPPTEE